MRSFLLCLCLTGGLGAQAPLHIVAVERRGPPPYEEADRIYALDGGQEQGLRVGARLLVRRPGEAKALGHLWLTRVYPARAEARFEPAAEASPMKGDLALREELKPLPELRLEVAPLPGAPPPLPSGVPPPQEGLLFFLPRQAGLSPAGQKKLETWVGVWGTAGRWAVQVPMAKAVRPALRNQRAEALRRALQTLGVAQVAVEGGIRAAEGPNDPAWVRHWD